MTDRNLAISLGKLVIAAAWADGELHPTEVNVLKRLLLDVPGIGSEEWRELELYLDHPTTEQEVEALLQQVLDAIGSRRDKALVLSTLRALIEADGVVTPEEQALYDAVEAAVDATTTGVVGALSRLVGKAARAFTGREPSGLREERIEDYARNPLYFRLSHPENDRRPDFDLDDDALRTACLVAGVMAKVAQADAGPSDDEMTLLRELLVGDFGLDAADAARLSEVAVGVERLDIFRLGDRLRQRLEVPERRRLLTGLYRIAQITDGVAEREEVYLRKITQCLGLKHQDFVNAKVAAKRAADPVNRS